MALSLLARGASPQLVPAAAQQARTAFSALTKLPDLPYDYSALEPAISGQIMELHHSKHHQTYVNTFNAALEKYQAAESKGDIASTIALQSALKFNGGGGLLSVAALRLQLPSHLRLMLGMTRPCQSQSFLDIPDAFQGEQGLAAHRMIKVMMGNFNLICSHLSFCLD